MINELKKNAMSIHHLVLTVSDLETTEIFYTQIFGAPSFLNNTVAIYDIGSTNLIFMQGNDTDILNNKAERGKVGLEHFAISIKDLEDLKEIDMVLNEHQIEHSGIHIDSASKKEKIWLDDPNNFRVEFYLSDIG